MSVKLQRRRFTVDEYHAMAEAGILSEDDRVELIEGEIIQMAAIGSQHAACVGRLTRLMVEQTGSSAIVWPQNPVRVSQLSEPQPDLAVLRPRDDFYAGSHPGAADALLIIEVSHTTLAYDREVKIPLYAAAEVPEVWIVNVEDAVVEVYAAPRNGRFGTRESARRGDVLRPRALPGVTVPVASILG